MQRPARFVKQKKVRREPGAAALNLLATLLALVIARNIVASSGLIPADWPRLLQGPTWLSNEVLATLLAALVSARYIVTQLKLAHTPLVGCNTGREKQGEHERWRCKMTNAGAGPAEILSISYDVALKDGQAFFGTYRALRAFLAPSLADDAIKLEEINPHFTFRAGGEFVFLDADYTAYRATFESFDVDIRFRDMMGDEWIRRLVCVPVAWGA